MIFLFFQSSLLTLRAVKRFQVKKKTINKIVGKVVHVVFEVDA